VNRSSVKIKQALGKDGDRDDAAAQNWPHQQSALLDVIDHAGFCNALSRLWQASKRLPLSRTIRCTTVPYREFFARAFGEGDGRALVAPLPPTNFPDASRTE
jgi:hypothetical protein